MQASAWIDSHFHLYTDGLDITNAAEMLPRVLQATGVSAVSIACVPFPLFPGYDTRQVALALQLKAMFPTQVFVFGALDYSGAGAREGKADFAAQARRLFEMGVDGFKMLEGKPTSRRILSIPMDSPAYDPFYTFLEEQSLPLLAHVSDPEICWDAEKAPDYFRAAGYFYADGSLPLFEAFRAEALHVARKHPGLKLTLAHFFFASSDVDQAAQIMERHPNVAFDLTPNHDMYDDFAGNPDAWRDFFIRYDTRILYGTDSRFAFPMDPDSLRQQQNNAGFVRGCLEKEGDVVADVCGHTYRSMGLHLPRRTLEKIGSRNYIRRLSHRAPRSVEASRFSPSASEG